MPGLLRWPSAPGRAAPIQPQLREMPQSGEVNSGRIGRSGCPGGVHREPQEYKEEGLAARGRQGRLPERYFCAGLCRMSMSFPDRERERLSRQNTKAHLIHMNLC